MRALSGVQVEAKHEVMAYLETLGAMGYRLKRKGFHRSGETLLNHIRAMEKSLDLDCDALTADPPPSLFDHCR